MDVNATLAVAMILGGVILVSLVAILGGFLQCRRERLLTHAERMKALELGRSLPDDAATARVKAAFGIASGAEDGEGGLARKCYSTALWVAFWGFMAASQGGSAVGAGVAYVVAVATGAIGVTAVICGTILAARGAVAVPGRAASAKPAAEEDALDVVSCRG